MEILVLGLVALALVFTFFLIALKLVWLGGKLLFGLLLLPFKAAGTVVSGAVGLALLPVKLAFFLFLIFFAVVVGFLLLPMIIPVLILGAVVLALISSC